MMIENELGAGTHRDQVLFLYFEQVLHLHILGIYGFNYMDRIVSPLRER